MAKNNILMLKELGQITIEQFQQEKANIHLPYTCTRKAFKSGLGRTYIEQLVKNASGGFSLQKVRVSRIKSGKFTEQTMFGFNLQNLDKLVSFAKPV